MGHWQSTDRLGRMVESLSMKKKKAVIDTLSVSESSLTKETKTCNSPDWTGLPGGIVLDIADRLMSRDIEDFVRFGAVCTSWRTILLQNKKHQVCSLCSPLLLITPPLEPEEEVIPNYQQQKVVYSPGKNKVYRPLRLHVPRYWTGCSSSFGWLINMDLIIGKKCSSNVHLQNPLLNKIIHLPSIDGYFLQDGCTCDFCKCDGEEHISSTGQIYLIPDEHLIQKAALSSDPLSSSGEFIVVGIMGLHEGLAFFKSGTENWTSIGGKWEENGLVRMYDVIFYHKAKQFYVSHSKGEVLAIHFVEETGVPQLTKVADALPSCAHNYTHLVEDLSSGDLYQFYIKNFFMLEHHFRFVIFKFDATEKEWIRIHDLGDKIIFFGSNGSFLRSASNCPGCKPNCIYFFTNARERKNYQLPDEGIYSMKDGSVQPLYTNTVKPPSNRFPTTVWLEPTLV